MISEAMRQILQTIEYEVNSRPSAIEFEMAYHARIAIDRIRFAIKHTEQFGQNSGANHETGLQLLDALQRLEMVDRRFQERSRTTLEPRSSAARSREAVNGHETQSSGERKTDCRNEVSRGDSSK